MALEVDYVPFATGDGANVYEPSVYQALSVVSTGVEPGIADPQLYNTTARLASMTSAALANYISETLGIDVLDDGNLSNLITELSEAVSLGSRVSPGRIVTSSGAVTVSAVSDYAIGLNRTTDVAATPVNLPSAAATNQEFRVDDLSRNANAYNISINAPEGDSICGLASFVIAVNGGGCVVHYYGSSIWGVIA